VTYIYMADRLNQLPLGLIGIGLGTVLLPTISRQLGSGQVEAAQETQNRGMELALLLTLPATVALVLCGEPIAAALFGYGRFSATDTHFTAQALAAFSIGLPSYILVKVLTPVSMPGRTPRPRSAMRRSRWWSIWSATSC
jgi:putative peptidoglycan lipid II flippase